MKLNNKEKKILNRIKNNFNIMTKNFILSFETGSSVLGFIIAQFVWIWILKGFLGWFVLWICEVTNYRIGDVFELTHIFWIIYGLWFFISIIVRLRIINYTKEDSK